jgi:hypothetical protein
LQGKYDFDLHFVLQEKDAAAGDYIVRARGAWFGNRSISAEVDLPAGIYEVLPKIEASRDKDVADVEQVVTKLAESNPQKLRQIGLNYDIANAKGLVEPTEEERQKKEQKRKEAAEKKQKEKEEEEKEKADFEAWKKEEKEEYEAWKKEKQRREARDTSKPDVAKEVPKDSDTEADEAKKGEIAAQVANLPPDAQDTEPAIKAEEVSPAVAAPTEGDLPIRPKEDPSKPEGAKDAPADEDAAQPTIQENADNDQNDARNDPSSDDDETRPRRQPQRGPPSVIYYNHPHRGDRYQGSVYGDGPVPPPPQKAAADTPKPWNAVCVLGLRVYSQDPEVSIKLIKPKDVEEGAILDVDGNTAAGATM